MDKSRQAEARAIAFFAGEGKLSEVLRYVPQTGAEEEKEGSLADVIVEAWNSRMERNPDQVKESIENYLAFLSPEDQEAFLAEKLQEVRSNG